MESTLLSQLPNLGVGVASIVGLIIIVTRFINHLENRGAQHERAMKEREDAFRSLESEIRNNILSQLNESAQIMRRVADLLNKI